jgi:asparagine synthase (glutamine-hydrolysing)
VFRAWRRLRKRDLASPGSASAIHPDFSRRLNLSEQRLLDPDEWPARDTLTERLRILKPGRSFIGALQAESGAANGLEIRDPSGDARVLAYTFSVPDEVFIEPRSGLDRWLIRAAMEGRLPDPVRLNRRRGQQAADLVPRLRACAPEVETALAELAGGPAAAYLDLANMRSVWQLVQTEDTPESFHKSITVLTRGIMAGLFVNQFYAAA